MNLTDKILSIIFRSKKEQRSVITQLSTEKEIDEVMRNKTMKINQEIKR